MYRAPSRQARSSPPLGLETIARLKYPPHRNKTHRQEQRRHPKAHADMHIGDLVEAPAEAAHQVGHGIEEGHGLPDGREDAHGVEGAAEEGKRRDDEERDELELLEALGPQADDEAEQAE